MNLNKLFPRLTISSKLAIAFVLVAMIPLALVAAVGTRSAVLELRASGEAALQHDMELAFTRTARSLREVEQHVTFVTEVAAAAVLSEGQPGQSVRQTLDAYLASDPSPIFRFKIIDDSGFLRLAVDRRSSGAVDEAVGGFEPLYQWTAAELAPAGRAFLPIEVRGTEPLEVTPAIAIVVPVYLDGTYAGAVVGEAEAELLFAELDVTAPGLEGGATALTDEEGRFLFHSEFKSEWGSLLSAGGEVGLEVDLPTEVAARVMSGDGAERLEDGRFVSYRSIPVGSPPVRSLVLYRTLPATFIDARIRRFLVLFGAVGAVLGLVVLAISAVAARQITRPIYALTAASHTLAEGGLPDPVPVETNDELEDLAVRFHAMATTLTNHREQLESLVEERTKRLLETEAHLGRIVTDAADAILALSCTGEITLWNRGAEELFGYSPSEALGRSVNALLAPSDNGVGASPAPLEMVTEGDAVNFRTRRRTKAGEWIPVAVTRSALHDDQGRTVGHSLIIRDERAREMLEEQMRRSERLTTISVMAGGIAHELNNPLSIIGNRIELMQREAVRQDAGVSMLEDLEVLRKHVGRIGSVTADLIKFARDEADELGAIDVAAVVDRVTRLLGKVMRESGIALEVVTEDDMPSVLGSESVVETVLVNLLLNAQQATPPGGDVVVETSRDATGKVVRIEVRDSGPGVPEELRLRIFEPFFTTKAEHGGTGLGLAVCRALVDRVGGTLDLLPSNTRGARFVVSFPQQVKVPA